MCGVVAFSARAVRSPSKRQDSSLQVSTQLPTPVAVLWHCFCSEASNPAVGWQGTCLWVDGEVVWTGTLVVRWCCWHVLVCCLLCSDLACRAGKMIFASSAMTDRW